MVVLPTLAELETAAQRVYAAFPPTPQVCWPLLCQRAGCEVWVKHENHTPVGAFKVRGGLTYLAELRHREPQVRGVILATRGNHGQSIAFAARQYGIEATVVVPHGNSVEKNAAMRALGAKLIEEGHDFQAALEFASKIAAERGLHFLPSFHPWLVRGVGTYALELFRAVPDLDTVYVPIGLGSGICGTIAARAALGLRMRVVGVVAEQAPCYALSVGQGRAVSTDTAETIADGMACRVPNADALEIIRRGADHIVTVSEAEIRAAMRHYFTDTHNVAEGAGAGPLAALLKERDTAAGRRVAVILSGGNVDAAVYHRVLAEEPQQFAFS
jgi:threonine dehydratase